MIDTIVIVGSAFALGYALCNWFPPCAVLGKLGCGACRTKAKAGKGRK
jgi:hypothetical protein